MTVRKRRKRRSKVLPVVLGIIASLMVFTCAYGLTSGWWFPGGSDPVDLDDIPGLKGKDSLDLEGFNVLLLGTDDREAGDNYSRTDTIIVLNYNDKANRMSMLSIPRDTRVQIPGHGMDKINAANVFGGPELVTKTVSQLIGVPIEYYILTNFYGFKDIVDALGGVTLNVEKDMRHSEKAYGGEFAINLKKGEQRLDGDKALQYVRYRGDAYGDITRTGRQLKFLQALAEETMQARTVTRLHKLIPEIYENVETNMGLSQLLKLARAGKSMDSVEMVTQTLPGHFLDTAQGSFWAVDQDEARRVAAALFEEGKVIKEVVQGPTEDLRSQPQQQAKEVMVSHNSGNGYTEQDVSRGNRDSGTETVRKQPAGDTSAEPVSADNSEGKVSPGTGDGTAGQPEPAEPAAEAPVDDSTPPGGLPVDQPDQNSSNKKVEIIIDIDNS